MKSYWKKIGALVAVGLLPLLAGAAEEPPRGIVDTGEEPTNIQSIEDIQDLMTRSVGWTQVFFYIIATLFIVFTAFRYLTSGGDEEKIKGAKDMLIYSIVAIAIAAIAGGVVLIVKNFLNS